MERRNVLKHVVVPLSKGVVAIGLCMAGLPTFANGSSATKPDALLSIDMNRAAVVERIVGAWSKELQAAQAASFRSKLTGLRADQLLAANLSGSFEGVLEVLQASESSVSAVLQVEPQTAQVERVSQTERTGDSAKIVGDVATDLVYTPIAPCRVFDTRTPGTPFISNGLTSGVTQLFDIDGTNLSAQGGAAAGCNVPPSARAVVLAVSPISPPTTGWFVGAANDSSPLPASTLFNYSSALTLTTFTVVMPMLGGGGGDIRLQARGVSAYSMDAVGDVTGYFLPVNRGNITNNVPGNVFAVTNTNGAGFSAALRGNSESGNNNGVGVWGNHSNSGFGVYGTASTNGYGVYGVAPVGNGAAVYAEGDIKVADFGALSFGTTTRQMINLWGPTKYGIGVQAGTQYYRVDSDINASGNGGFAWYQGGVHSNSAFDPGLGGGTMMQLTRGPSLKFPSTVPTDMPIEFRNAGQGIGGQPFTTYLRTNTNIAFFVGGSHANSNLDAGGGSILATIQAGAGTATVTGNVRALGFTPTSDRASKSAFSNVNAKSILAKVAALPISTWAYNAEKESGVRHIGPVAQDFKKAFNVGYDDKSISLIDASGVALSAIKGLSEIVTEKEAKIVALERANAAMQRELTAIKKKLGM
jgi:Chaperone of endosialidase